MSITSDLLAGLAQLLNDAGIGVVYKASGGYVSTETGVFFKELPTSPDRVVVISAYMTTDQVMQAWSTARVQFWFRGNVNDSLDVDALGDAVFGVVHNLTGRQFGSVYVIQALRQSSIQLGVDGNKRSERSDNYAVDINVPTSTLRPE